jgi:integrase
MSSSPRRNSPKLLTRDQLAELLAAAKGEPYEALITFLAFTGVRLGEAVALRWAEVDLERKTARIVRSVRLRHENVPKTKFGRRAIDLPTRLVTILKTLPHDHELVFHQDDGGFINARHLHHVFRRISKRAGLPRVHPHMLRHTWATQMLNSEAPLNYVSRALGHHSTAFTAATYVTAQLVDQAAGTK